MKCKSIMVMMMLLMPTFLFGQKDATGHLSYAISLGTVFPGKIQAAYHLDFKPDETATFYNKICFLLRGNVDYAVWTHLSGGISLNYVPIVLKDVNQVLPNDVTIHMAEIDGNIKGILNINSGFCLKPCLEMGYRRTFSNEKDAREAGFCLNNSLECCCKIADKMSVMLTLGYFTQPYGGVKDVAYVRAFPIFYSTAGLNFNI